jgi:hypothetical protein
MCTQENSTNSREARRKWTNDREEKLHRNSEAVSETKVFSKKVEILYIFFFLKWQSKILKSFCAL